MQRVASLARDKSLVASSSAAVAAGAAELAGSSSVDSGAANTAELERRLELLDSRLEEIEADFEAEIAEMINKYDSLESKLEEVMADEVLRSSTESKSMRARIKDVEDAKKIDSTLRVDFMNGFDADRRALFERLDQVERKVEASLSAHRSLYANETSAWRAEAAALSHRLDRLERAAH